MNIIYKWNNKKLKLTKSNAKIWARLKSKIVIVSEI